MKLWGSLSELVSLIFRKDSQQITVRPNQSTTYTAARDIQLPPGDAAHVLTSASSTQTLTNKTLTSPVINTPTGIVKGDVGLGNVDNTSNATERAATATLTNKTLTSPVINTPTGLVKGDVGLGNVDNTSNATERAATATLTNKTLTSPVINTPTGITKSDVGLSNVDNTSNATERAATATLTNKTLTSPILDDYFDVNEEAAPGTPASGKVRVYAKTDKKLYTKDSSGVEQEIGSGSSSGNVSFFFDDLENGSAANWTGYADAAAATPVDGTGGTATTLTVTASSSSPLREVFSLSVAKSAANGQGQGIAASVAIPSGYQQAAKRVIEFLWDGSDASYVAGDMACYVYDVTNSLLITPSVAALPATKVPIQISWDSSTSASYRLIFHVASTNASAYTVKLDDITVGPGVIINAAPIGFMGSFTPVFTGVTVTVEKAVYYRRGDNIKMDVEVLASGNATATVAFLPNSSISGITLDTTKVGLRAALGSARLSSTTNSYTMTPHWDSPDVRFTLYSESGSLNATLPTADAGFDTGDRLSFSIEFPVSEWAGAPNYAGQNDVEFVADDGSSDVFGPQGALVPNVAAGTGTTTREFTFVGSPQQQDMLVVEILSASGRPWTMSASIYPFLSGNNANTDNFYGVRGEWTSTTTYRVTFGNQGERIAASNASAGNSAWSTLFSAGVRFRVRKASGGSAVGFSAATATSQGLVKGGTVPGQVSGAAVAAGYIGEVITASLSNVTSAATTLWTTNAGTLTLTPGIWLASASIKSNAAGTTRVSFSVGISAVSGAEPTGYVTHDSTTDNNSKFLAAAPRVFNVSSSTPIYVNMQNSFTGTAPTTNGSESNFFAVRIG